MKTKIISVMLVITIMFGLFFYGSNANGFNAQFYGSKPTYTYQSSGNLFRTGFNANNNYARSSNLFSGSSSSSLNYRFGLWAI